MATQADPAPLPSRPHWGRRLLIGLGALVALLLVAVLGLYLWLDTQSGRNFVTRQIGALTFANGMTIGIGRIEGSVYGAMHIHDLTLRDTKGVFLAAPDVALDWRPFAYLRKHVDIRELSVPTARLYRTPLFKATPPSDQPLLPDLDIDIGRLEVGRLQIDPPVTGKRHLVGLKGNVHIADGRAQIAANGHAFAAPGVAGGDRLALRLDAVPRDNRLDLDLKLDAPANGLVASYSGIARPVSVSLAGKGSWAAWQGRLGGMMGSERLADVAITARNGTFSLRGPFHPGLFLTGSGRDMLEPATQVDLTAHAEQRRVQLDAHLASDNFTFAAKGLADLAQNRFGDMRLDFRLLKPSVIAKNLSGADIAAQASLDGAFIAPDISYSLAARQIGFGATRIDGLAVSGSARLDKDQWRIPVHGRAQRISGVAANIAPLLTSVRLDGDLAYANGRLLSDNIRLLSDRINARAVVIADLPRALYTGALNGRVNGYQVESIGTFNLMTDLDLKSGKNGSFRLAGRVTARSTRIVNDSLRNFLGGDALIVADVGYGSDGVATVDRLSVAAPAFRLTNGRGRYGADGAIRFAASGQSNQYGPLSVDMSGTVARPLVHLRATRPGLGIGVADVDATVRGRDGIYDVQAKGGTDYGPLAANVNVATGKGPLRIDVRQGTSFGGVGFTGQVTQTAAGPFAGTLRAGGSGIQGQVQLSSYNGSQRALIDATARDATLPGRIGLTARRATLKADLVVEKSPVGTADLQLAGTRLGDLYIAAARLQANYRDGAGQAKLLLEGRTRYPFRVAANADLAPNLWRVALTGRVNGIDVQTQGPMRIVPAKDSYRLETSTLSVGTGKLQLAGSYGQGLQLQSRLQAVDLALANPFLPDLGLGGMATGSLDFNQSGPSAFPTADARLKIDDFTRTGLTAVSEPVDIEVVGRLEAEGGNARALVSRRGASVGRMQVNLRPLPPGAGTWMTRLLAAPLSGGVRYNGPADVLFSLAALPDQSLSGAVGVAADFTGRVRTPQLTGVVRADNLTYQNGSYGTRLTNMQVQGRFTNDRLQVEKLTARAGNGTVSASGFVSLSSGQGFPIQLGIEMNNAQLASGQDLSAQASGQLRVVNGPGQPPTVSGRISLPETHYTIVREGSAKVARLTGIRRKPALGRERITGAPEPMTSLPATWHLDVTVAADNKIYVTGMGLNSEWAANIHVGGTSGAPVITGTVTLVRGTLGFAGHSFDLQQGRISFNGGALSNPELNIVASGDIEDVTMNIAISGSAQNPQIAFTSTPSLPQDELMSRVLFGSSVGQLTAIQAIQLASSLNSLRGSGGGLNPLGVLQSASGIDRIRILGADEKTGRETSLAVGQYITNDVYVEIVTDARGYTATQLEVSLSRALSVLSEVSSFGTSSLNLRYKKDY